MHLLVTTVFVCILFPASVLLTQLDCICVIDFVLLLFPSSKNICWSENEPWKSSCTVVTGWKRPYLVGACARCIIKNPLVLIQACSHHYKGCQWHVMLVAAALSRPNIFYHVKLLLYIDHLLICAPYWTHVSQDVEHPLSHEAMLCLVWNYGSLSTKFIRVTLDGDHSWAWNLVTFLVYVNTTSCDAHHEKILSATLDWWHWNA